MAHCTGGAAAEGSIMNGTSFTGGCGRAFAHGLAHMCAAVIAAAGCAGLAAPAAAHPSPPPGPAPAAAAPEKAGDSASSRLYTAVRAGDAAGAGGLERVKLLVKGKDAANSSDSRGLSCLHLAIRCADPAVRREMAESRGRDEDGEIVTGEIIDRAQPLDKIRYLLAEGADPNHIDSSGWTPMMLAANVRDAHSRQEQRTGGTRGSASQMADEDFCIAHDPADIVRALVEHGAKNYESVGRFGAIDNALHRRDGRARSVAAAVRTAPAAPWPEGAPRMRTAEPGDGDEDFEGGDKPGSDRPKF